MGNGSLSPGVKRPRRDGDHSPPSDAEVRNERKYTSTPSYVFMALYLIILYKRKKEHRHRQFHVYKLLFDTELFTGQNETLATLEQIDSW
jgi:hypothetical protein